MTTTTDYYQKALDLVYETLRDTPDDQLIEKRDKLAAIVANAVHWWRTAPCQRCADADEWLKDGA